MIGPVKRHENTGAIIKVAARQLAESVRRRGGLAAPLYAGISGLEGSRIHRDFQEGAPRLFPGRQVFPEVSLKGLYQDQDLPFDLQVQGRCDLVTLSAKGDLTLIEVKGFRGQAQSLPEAGDPAHLAQAYVYGHLLLTSDFVKERGLEPKALDLEVRYLPFDGGTPLIISQKWSKEALAQEFDKLCQDYGKLLTPLFLHRLDRDRSNRAASFPYLELREGQKAMMQEVIAAIRDKSLLFVQAPTGIGKTMATLYPALKAQANDLTDQIFYLTPTRSQRQVAEDSLEDLEAQGFRIRSLTLQAKEQSCLAPQYFCDMRVCPYAVNFHDGLAKALIASYETRRLLPGTIQDLARTWQLCPFELAMALIPTSDVVICDYNYVFNPRIRLHDLDEPQARYSLLVDEAHNLARRSREMFSAVLTRSGLQGLKEGLTPFKKGSGQGDKGLAAALGILDRLLLALERFDRLLASHEDKEAQAGLMEALKACQPVRAEKFLATRIPPPWIMEDLASLTGLLTRFLLEHPDFPGRQALMLPYFDLLYFQRVADDYYDQAYITSFKPGDKGEFYLTLLALDASKQLTALYRDRSPVVFFSATLTPLPYYLSLLDARSALEKPQVIRLKSPFPRERRLMVAYQAHSLRYQDRPQSLPAIARLIRQVAGLRKGNYLVFSPSFAYQRQLVRILSAEKDDRIDYLVQPARMTQAQRDKYLAYFQREKQDKSLLGLTVMGSLFNEGVDLVGEALTGVIIIGTGLPGLSPERDILRQYYDGKSGQGYDYAYVWPGFNRVTQAAGRLIRSEEDFGFVLLIDDRYGRPDYGRLFPDDWQVHHVDQEDECLDLIREFWKDFD